ncbi:2Fe-2S iron-sulfur cluster-binding protein [Chloroflexota bacterium]
MIKTMEVIELTIDGLSVHGRKGMTILKAAQENGVEIPTLCYSPELTPIGACRICVVEVDGSRTLVGSCHTPISQGMVVYTHSPKVIEVRRAIVELLLSSHPDSCLVCDKGNQCELHKIAADLEIGIPRFRSKRRYYPIDDVSPYIVRDLSKCILCRKCIAACNEIKKARVFSMAYRGFHSKVVVDLDHPLDKDICRDCDVCTSRCPTGALSKPSKAMEGKKGESLIISG